MSATNHVALLRGINVGGKNMLPMRELAALFEEAGCSDVATYIQSGNVVFRAPPRVATKIAERVETLVFERRGFRSVVVTRSADELRAVIAGNTYVEAGVDAKELHVMFLAHEPTQPALSALDPHRSPPDTFDVRGRDIYLRLPNGTSSSKLTNAYFDAKLATTSTIRNWNTVLAIAKLLETLR